jgi:uncharacterized protein YbjT (DUF2867 family)
MKIVIMGGSGFIGSRLVVKLNKDCDRTVSASPITGVNTVTGAGLAEVLSGAVSVVDVTNTPSFADDAAMAFFQTSGGNLLKAEAAAGVQHHVCLSIVGVDRALESGYMRAKLAQERIVKDSGVPYTIVRSTQFFEFLNGIAEANASGDVITVSPALVQPIAADDVVAMLADVATSRPLNATIEVAGPERMPLNEMISQLLRSLGDTRRVVSDRYARYFGLELNDQSLTPGDTPRIGRTHYEDWLAKSL